MPGLVLIFFNCHNHTVTHRNKYSVTMNIEKITDHLFGLYDSTQTARMIGISPTHLRVIRQRTGQPHAIAIGRDRFYRGVDVLVAVINRANSTTKRKTHQ